MKKFSSQPPVVPVERELAAWHWRSALGLLCSSFLAVGEISSPWPGRELVSRSGPCAAKDRGGAGAVRPIARALPVCSPAFLLILRTRALNPARSTCSISSDEVELLFAVVGHGLDVVVFTPATSPSRCDGVLGGDAG